MLALESPTTEGHRMADLTTASPAGVLSAADVAALWTEVARQRHAARVAARAKENAERRLRNRKPRPDLAPFQEIKPETVLTYHRQSGDTKLGGGRPRRYASHPMPAPAGRFGVMPWWRDTQREELIQWYKDRPGQGHGRGGRWAGRSRAGQP